MLENTIEQTDLTMPVDAVELSMDDLEEVTGAWEGGSCFGGFGSCFTAIKFSVDFRECFEFITFGGGWGSCWN
jgi:hypothetical protein